MGECFNPSVISPSEHSTKYHKMSYGGRAGEKQSNEASVLTSVGFWASDKGFCHIFRDKITSQLSYEELIGDGSEKIFGRLDETGKGDEDCFCWEASLMIIEKDDEPWYGPSCGEQPEVIGEVHVRLISLEPPHMETKIRTEGEPWQPAVSFNPMPADS